MNALSNRLLLVITLVSYLFSFFSSDKWDLPMFLALPVSFLGVYDFYTLLVPVTGFSGIGVLMYLAFRNKLRKTHHNGLLLSGLLLLLGPFLAIHNKESILLEWEHGAYLFIPELLFFGCFILFLKRILVK